MTKPSELLPAACLFAAWALGCAEAGPIGYDTTLDPAANQLAPAPQPTAACPVLVDDKSCDRQRRPIVFVHGAVSAGDAFDHPAQLFASNGQCALQIRAVDYDATKSPEQSDAYASVSAELTQQVDQLLDRSGAERVDVIAHAGGAAHAARWVGANPQRVAHYIHLAGGQLSENPGGVPTLCLSSVGDRPVQCHTTKNLTFQDPTLDHFAVCTSREAFVEMYAFLNGRPPTYDSVQCGEPIVIEGRALRFGDNQRLLSGAIEVYALGDQPRERGLPVTTLAIREDGGVGPWILQRGAAYEFKLVSGAGAAPRYVYFPPFKRSDRLLRFSYAPESPAALAQSPALPLSDATAALWIRRRQGAFLNGRDQLLVDGIDAVNAQDAMPRASVLGLYVLDHDGDRRSSGGAVVRHTFASGTDIYLQTERPAYIQVEQHGQRLQIPNWPSRSGGLSIVFLD